MKRRIDDGQPKATEVQYPRILCKFIISIEYLVIVNKSVNQPKETHGYQKQTSSYQRGNLRCVWWGKGDKSRAWDEQTHAT